MTTHREKLLELSLRYAGIKKIVIDVTLESDNILDHFNHVLSEPSIEPYLKGMSVTTFFGRYYEQIESIRKQSEKDSGDPTELGDFDTKTYLISIVIIAVILDLARSCGFEIRKSNDRYILH